MGTNQKVFKRKRNEHFDEDIQCSVKGSVPIELQHTKINIVPTESRLEDVEAYGNSFQSELQAKDSNKSLKEHHFTVPHKPESNKGNSEKHKILFQQKQMCVIAYGKKKWTQSTLMQQLWSSGK